MSKRWIVVVAVIALILIGAYPIVKHNNDAMHSLAGETPIGMMH